MWVVVGYEKLLQSEDPSVRWKVRARVLGEAPASPGMRALREEIRASQRVQTLLSERLADGRVPYHAYQKWRGAHWLLALLADLGYPPGDEALLPLRDQVCEWLFPKGRGQLAPVIDGRARHCASLEGNALYAMLTLGIADERVDELARRLAAWQWPDGGWNCDKKPAADHSSFMESLIPLRGLALHARLTGSAASKAAAERAAEFFLDHRLYRRHSSGEPIHPSFMVLHYPCFWHYDILFGLKVMAEAGHLSDPRCVDAVQRLRELRLPDGSFKAHARFYHVTTQRGPNTTLVDWGNDFVSAEALAYC